MTEHEECRKAAKQNKQRNLQDESNGPKTNRKAVTNPKTLLTKINYTRTKVIEYANEHNMYKWPQNKRN